MIAEVLYYRDRNGRWCARATHGDTVVRFNDRTLKGLHQLVYYELYEAQYKEDRDRGRA
jgi:hypothetical protein